MTLNEMAKTSYETAKKRVEATEAYQECSLCNEEDSSSTQPTCNISYAPSIEVKQNLINLYPEVYHALLSQRH